MKMLSSLLLFSFTLLPASSLLADAHGVWSYNGDGAPDRWGQLDQQFVTCEKGRYQSPVDIRDVVEGHLPPLPLSLTARRQSIINNGHTIQLNVEDGDSMKLDGETFTLQQFHFHEPAENLINGLRYPLEAHFVYQNNKQELAVVSVMFTYGQANPALAEILAHLPTRKDLAEPLIPPLSLATLLPASKRYYRFSGSLTTPPCTEGVRWLVMQQPVELSEMQVKSFTQALGVKNNRPVQPLHGRMIIH